MPSKEKAPQSTSTSKAGITTDPTTQSRYIPSSVRPDGTTRKEIKVRPGYRPPEDVELYKNRTAEAWKNRGGGGVPGLESLQDDDAAGEKGTAARNKNAKRREARKRAKEVEGEDGDAVNGDVNKAKEKEKENKKPAPATQPATAKPEPEEVDSEAEKEKKARTLKKKLRQARELREKKDKGEDLLPEQFEKVIRIQEIIRQLESLGFDAEGERKKVG
jgi:partner of Y14 and mago